MVHDESEHGGFKNRGKSGSGEPSGTCETGRLVLPPPSPTPSAKGGFRLGGGDGRALLVRAQERRDVRAPLVRSLRDPSRRPPANPLPRLDFPGENSTDFRDGHIRCQFSLLVYAAWYIALSVEIHVSVVSSCVFFGMKLV